MSTIIENKRTRGYRAIATISIPAELMAILETHVSQVPENRSTVISKAIEQYLTNQ